MQKQKKITFITPPLSTMERYGVDHQSGGETIPLGLTYLAAATREAGYPTVIIDAERLGYDIEKTVDAILETDPDYVGITAVTISIDNASHVAKQIKERKGDIKILLGGHHFTAVPDETMKRFPHYDFGVIGEGERTVVDLLSAFNDGGDVSRVDGIMHRENGLWKKNTPRKRIKFLDELPMPAWDLLPDIAEYYCPPVHTVKNIPAVTLVTSRGCPGQCIFCANATYGNQGSYLSSERLMEMICVLYHNYGIREIQFKDDNFIVFKKRLMDFCSLLQKEQLNLVWTCTGRVDNVKPEILKAMKEAGCWQIWYGVESGSDEILKLIKKGTSRAQIIQAVEWTRKAGIEACGFFIIGHPGETKSTIMDTIKFAVELKLSECHASLMAPFPGSELYNNWQKYGSFDNQWKNLNGWQPTFIPEGMTADELRHYSSMFFRNFYFRPAVLFSYLKKIRSFRHFQIYFQGFLALLQFIWRSKIDSS